jgi:arylsulfatase A-like enzyme
VYGGTRDVMPALDALARESRVFTKAYVQASHSNYADPVPLSSHYPLRSREMYTFPENPPYPRVLVYDVLKALGYSTAIFSSQNENWGGMINYHRPSSLDRFFHAATFAGPTYAPWQDVGFAQWVNETGGAGSVDDRYTVNEAMQWIDAVAGQPFFLHMNLQNSHVPYVVPPDFPNRFGPRELDFTIMWGKFPVDRVAAVKDRYADSLAYVDAQIARLFDHLRRRDLWDDTVFVIGGDNGEAFYEHGFAAHASWLFDEVVKVPMIIRAPGLAPGLDDRPAMFLDIPPSLFELLALPPHPAFQGISLFEPRPNHARSIYMIAQTPSAYETAIVRARFKLHFAEREDRYILNDLVKDPGETTDVGPSRPDLVRDLSARLHRWRDEQLAYYADLPRQMREYPPVLED